MPAVNLVEDEEDDWHSLQLHGVQFEDYTTCNGALEMYGIQSVDQLLDHLTTAKEDEVAEHKAAFFDTLKGLEAARKYMCHFDTKNSIIMHRGDL
jgi:hypothetical protein